MSSSVAAIRSSLEKAGFQSKTVGIYMALLNKLLSRWLHAPETYSGVYGMLREHEWVERTLKAMYTIESMPSYLGYIVSIMKVHVHPNAMKLSIGKRKPEEVDAWIVYYEKAGYYRGMVAGMKSVGVVASDVMWQDSVGVQTASVDVVDAECQVDELELDDFVVPETPLSQQIPPTQVVGDIDFRDECPGAPMKKRKVVDATLEARVAALEDNYFELADILSRKLLA